MLQALLEILKDLGKLFLGIFTRKPLQPTPVQPPSTSPGGTPAPPPTPTPTPAPVGTRPPPAVEPVQSAWWHGRYAVTQDYGQTNFTGEPFNPRFPQFQHFHDGMDFALPLGTPIYAGRDCFVQTVGIEEFGKYDPYALILWTGTHDIWLLHLNDNVGLRHGQFVKTGTLLGHSGTRGNSTGPHLHFQVNPHGGNYQSSVDPHSWLLPYNLPQAAHN